jgi:multiple sugar transport system ATP-binding protein
MADIFLERVTKVFADGTRAVDEVTLRVADGELLVLLGPSGCGKSTTLRMIAGLDDPSAGTIAIGGRSVEGVSPRDRDVAMVFQNHALYPHMSVQANLAFPLKLRGTPRGETDARVRQAARTLGVEHLLGRRPEALSGGERQRVALGRAIVRSPRAFLFDEPLSNLDAKLRGQMRVEIKRLHRQLSATMIYVTHDQEEAMTLADRLAVMKNGRIRQCGSPLEVYHRPADRFVAGFVGTPPMNFLVGRLAAQGSEVLFADGPVQIQLLPEQAARLGAYAGKDVVLGVRPEAVSLEAAGRFAGKGNAFQATLDVVEPLGEKMDLIVSTSRQAQLVARVDSQEGLRPGQPIQLHVDLRKVHIFEAGDSGRNLRLPVG